MNKRNEKKQLEPHEDNKKSERVNAVVSEYAKQLRLSKSSDISDLIQAGMATLQSKDEAKEAIKKISDLQSQRNPLSNYQIAIEKVGVLVFFSEYYISAILNRGN